MAIDLNRQRCDVLSKEKELKLLNKNDKEARNELIERNLRLVSSMANKFGLTNNVVEYDDLFQFGIFGLIKAIEKFDTDKGNKFSTYATNWIFQKMNRGFKESRWNIKPSYSWSHEERKEKMTKCTSLDKEMLGDDDVRLLVDTIHNFEKGYNQIDLCDQVDKLLQMTNDKKRKILKLRFGILDGRERTLDEIGDHLGCSKEWIRKLQEQAFEEIRNGISFLKSQNKF